MVSYATFTNDFLLMLTTGDLVVLGDQDDLDMAMSLCKSAAAKEKAEMGKMELWVQER